MLGPMLHDAETLATIVGVLTVAAWVADQTLGDLRAILRSERRRFTSRS
jgi:hypothetical protein